MSKIQWDRLNSVDQFEETKTYQKELIDRLKHRETLVKYKITGKSYARIYFLNQAEDAIWYYSVKHKIKREACKIKDIVQIRHGFTTNVWKNCLRRKKISPDKSKYAFSILYRNNRYSLDLLADSIKVCCQWIECLEYLVTIYKSHLRSHHPITDRWISFLFSYVDRDHSGYLNRSEIQQLLFTLNVELDGRTIDQYYNQANIRIDSYEQLKNLDKEEFLQFYKFVSYRPELVKIMCQYNGNTSDETATLLSEYSILYKIPRQTPLEPPQDKSRLLFRPRQKRLPTVDEIENKKNYLTAEQLKDFLQNEEQITDLSLDESCKLIARFEPSNEGRKYDELGIDGFRLLLLHDEFCIMNPHKMHHIYHDMTRPLTDYFIATSHNTYIRDNQILGDCTPETYIHALRTGCRAVELDCYDGDNMEPIVYHVKNLTTAITFREIIHAIETQAFLVSPYPLFLNLENHCSYEQQGVMVRILKDIFKDRLLLQPLVDDFDRLPSPEDLKYKVLIRSRRYPKGKTPADPTSNRSNDETEPNPKDFHPDFVSLIIYAQIVSFTNIEHTMSTQKCFHTISFKESKLDELIDSKSSEHLDLIKLTKQHLVRVYPGAKRQDSSNIDPANYWIYGVQMAALNYQSTDESMCLQYGLFSDNGGCGYLLKPSCLLSDSESFDPKSKTHGKSQQIEILLISGQHLPKEDNDITDTDIVDPYVEVSTFGIDCDNSKNRTPSVRNNGLNPIWDYRIKLTIHCPELCLVKFLVRDEDRFGRSKFLGQFALPFTAIQPGYRHIKLKDKLGNFIHGTLFVHIKINE